MNKEDVMIKLRKLKALAEKGVGGEKINAEKLYRQLVKRYHMDESELGDDIITNHSLVVKEMYNRKLIKQIVCSQTKRDCKILVDKIPPKDRKTIDEAYGVKGANVFIECTELEFLEIVYKYEIYKNAFEKELETCLVSFCYVNDLLVNTENATEDSKYGKDFEAGVFLHSLAMDKINIHKGIERK